tara:strand:- start:281 stop:754 length:474 start_codon:yes stop_codon:yes gene_type:complete
MIELLMTSMLMWMGANCTIDNIHPKHNPCQYNYNVELPKVTFLSQKDLKNIFYNSGGIAVGSQSRVDLNGFYSMDKDTIFLEDLWDHTDEYSKGALFHELYHHVQFKNNVNMYECMAYREIPTALFTKKYVNSLGYDQDMYLSIYDSSCNVYYKGIK